MIDVTYSPLPQLAPRAEHAHKGDFGRALVVGGSLGMAGAPALAGMACLRSGTGLVTVATPRRFLPTVAGFCPAYMTAPLPDDGERLVERAADAIAALLGPATAAAVGPGLGRSAAITRLVADLYSSAPSPLVIDADALHALAASRPTPHPAGPRVLTPHAGEFAALSGAPLVDPTDDAERVERAASLARDLDAVVLLKGCRTVVTDGERWSLNATGNPGMATGGCGDVLAGVVLALLCQGLAPFDAARLAAHAHGLAGDLAAAKLGQVAMTAIDVVEHLGDAWRSLGYA
ncbi:MAG: NAD(P)H-hydrate dehydratase [Lacipirellulaceae bacterium]